MIRPILSLQRLSFDETEGRLLYQYDKGNLELERRDYLEFIARVTSHIPDKDQVMIRYYGLYSNAHRGKMRKASVDPSHPLIIEEEDRHVPSKGWENIVSFNIYLEVYITFSLFKNISTFYRLFSCYLLYLTFIFSLYINLKGVSKRNPDKN